MADMANTIVVQVQQLSAGFIWPWIVPIMYDSSSLLQSLGCIANTCRKGSLSDCDTASVWAAAVLKLPSLGSRSSQAEAPGWRFSLRTVLSATATATAQANCWHA
jgi:hypothetical protein